MARREVAARINLPKRSGRTKGRVVDRRCRLVARGGDSVRKGGLGFGGLGGSSEWNCRWPTRHKDFSKKVCTAAFSAAVSAR